MKKTFHNVLALSLFALTFNIYSASDVTVTRTDNGYVFDESIVDPLFGLSRYNLEVLVQVNLLNYPVDYYELEKGVLENGTTFINYNKDGTNYKRIEYTSDGHVVLERLSFKSGIQLWMFYYRSGAKRRYEITKENLGDKILAVSFTEDGAEESRIVGSNGDLLYRDEDGRIIDHVYLQNGKLVWIKKYNPKTGFLFAEFGDKDRNNYGNPDLIANGEYHEYDSNSGKIKRRRIWDRTQLMLDEKY